MQILFKTMRDTPNPFWEHFVHLFRPMAGAEPHIGQVGTLETVEEFKVELVCADEHIQAAIAALKLAHPYEEVAYDVWQLADL